MTQPQDKMRVEFEATMRAEPYRWSRIDFDRETDFHGQSYAWVRTQAAWDAWQAACAQQSAQSQRDSARLDYLQERGATVDLIIGASADAWKFRVAGWNTSINSDLRQSIDAAIAAQGASNV